MSANMLSHVVSVIFCALCVPASVFSRSYLQYNSISHNHQTDWDNWARLGISLSALSVHFMNGTCFLFLLYFKCCYWQFWHVWRRVLVVTTFNSQGNTVGSLHWCFMLSLSYISHSTKCIPNNSNYSHEQLVWYVMKSWVKSLSRPAYSSESTPAYRC